MNQELVEKMIAFWVGTPNNPLNGKTFKQISEMGEKYGYDLKGMKNDSIGK